MNSKMNQYSYLLLKNENNISESIFDRAAKYMSDAVTYPKYLSYESTVYHTRHSDGDYKVYICGYVGIHDLILLKTHPQFVKLCNDICENNYLRFECMIKYPFATPEIINIIEPHLNKTINQIEWVIASPSIHGQVWDKKCEIILKNDKNRYLGLNDNYEKYKKMIGIKCTIRWYQQCEEYRNVYDAHPYDTYQYDNNSYDIDII